MAAYGSLVSLSQTIQHFLRHEYDHPQLPTTLVGQIVSLQEQVNFLQAFLDYSHDEATTDLEGRIRDASNAAEYMLEYLMSGSEDLRELAARSQDVPFVRSLKNLWKEHNLTYNSKRLAHWLQNTVTQEIVSIVAEVMGIKNMTTTRHVGEVTDIKNNTATVEFGDLSSSRLPPSFGKDEIMVGFDDDLLAIKSCLCGNSSRLEIIPICGMGGIGKTTLARNAYEDPSTVHRFHIRAWVTVSQDYKAQEVLSRLQVSMKALVGERNGQGNEVVYKSLKGRRYLIVLDDMWSTEVWEDVKRLFPDDNNGSRILLTTRLAEVAVYAASSSNLHQMRTMDLYQSWQLLQQKVFKEDHCPPQLEDIGIAIARKCKGLPLAIVVVAGILSTINPTKASWQNVASKLSSNFIANDDEITHIFSLSYTNLPHHLRPCFLYMGRFPEDYVIRVSKLVKLWTAKGFLKPRGSECFEDVAEEYLEDLVKRSLVLVTKRELNGRIKSCSIHDLLRDLCIRKAKEEKFLLDGERHGGQLGFLNMYLFGRYVTHSLMFLLCYPQLSCLKRFRLPRLLDVKTKLKKFPANVPELYLLRYLAFSVESNRLYFDIPPSISKLQNLQTLIICVSKWTITRVRFPSEIWSMRLLRHLHVVGTVIVPLPEPYPTPFALQDLQTLATVRNLEFTERVLQMIQNVKKLGIYYDYLAILIGGSIEWAQVFDLHNLVHLHHLKKLSISVYSSLRSLPGIELQFPMTLKKLKLKDLKLSKQVMGNIGSLPNLEVLKLIHCEFEDGTWKTTEGEFPKLKVLKIEDKKLETWITESSHFPSLKHLHLSYCYKLREIPEGTGEIPTLELIEVGDWDHNISLLESAKRIKEEQLSYGNDFLQVRINGKIVIGDDSSTMKVHN